MCSPPLGAAGARRVVNTPGGAIYGAIDVAPTSEDVPADPVFGLRAEQAHRRALRPLVSAG